MKRFLSLFIALSCTVSVLCAQAPAQRRAAPLRPKPNYELPARFSIDRIGKMVFSTSIRPNWFTDANKFWYEYTTPQGKSWYIVDPATGSKKEIFDKVDIAARLTEIVKDPFEAQHIPIMELKQKEGEIFSFYIVSTIMETPKKDAKKEGDGPAKGNGRAGKAGKEPKKFYFEYNAASGKLTHLEDFEATKPFPRWASVSPDKEKYVYSKNYNLYWMDRENFEKARKDQKDSTIVEHPLTTDGQKDYSYGYSNYDLYADSTSMARRSPVNMVWSPDSKYFIFVRSDDRKVKDLWVIDVLAQPRPKLEAYKYEMPGEENVPQEALILFDFENKTQKTIRTAAFKDQHLSLFYTPLSNMEAAKEGFSMTWLGDNNKFYMQRSSRDLKRIDLCSVSLGVDTARTIIPERMNTYQETQAPKLINGGKEIIQWSERSGWAQLYLYDSDGNLKNPITTGPWHVSQIIDVDEATRTIFFTACGREKGENPYYTHLYSARLDGSEVKLLTPGDFHFTVNGSSDDCKSFIADYSRVDTAPQTALFDRTGRKIKDLETTDLSLLFEAGYKYPECFTVKAADGITDLYGVMYKPFDFDPNRKYPIIEYVYPGPQVEAVNQAWSKNMERMDRLAQFGFIVITVGNRGGHPDRSKWYHNYGYGNLRDYGLADQKVAVERLAARHSFIDINRVGIHGHSGGGFMSTTAILTYPDFYDVAVSCAGNHENNIYNRWWSETHHGVQEEVSAKGDTSFVYNIDRNTQLASRLKGHLLLIHGDVDNNVHPGNTLRMVDALIRANKRFDLLILPGQRHGFGDMREYFFWRMGDYYCKYLLGSQETTVDIPQLNNDQ